MHGCQASFRGHLAQLQSPSQNLVLQFLSVRDLNEYDRLKKMGCLSQLRCSRLTAMVHNHEAICIMVPSTQPEDQAWGWSHTVACWCALICGVKIALHLFDQDQGHKNDVWEHQTIRLSCMQDVRTTSETSIVSRLRHNFGGVFADCSRPNCP